jgi:hypothetical protein
VLIPLLYNISKSPSLTDEELAGSSTWGEGLINHKPDGELSTVFRIMNVLQYTFRPGSWGQSAGVSTHLFKIREEDRATGPTSSFKQGGNRL